MGLVEGLVPAFEQDEQISEAYQDFMVDPSSKVHGFHTPKPFTVRRFGFNLNTPTVACGYKHGQVRTMVHWIAKVCGQHRTTPLEELRFVVVDAFSRFIHLLDSEPPMLTEEVRLESRLL